MNSMMRWGRVLVVGVVAMLVASTSGAVSLKPDAKLPDPVESTFRGKYPKAEIEKIDVTEENGVNVYDIEFTDGKMEKETDIAEDGTMLEFTHVVPAKEIPAAPLKVIRDTAKTAKGKLGRLERIEIDYITKDGKVEKLPETVIRYAAEMARKGEAAEIIVNADGSVSEAPDWQPAAK